MNLPNKLTIFRIVLIPVFIFFLLSTYIPHNSLIALLVFSIASFTDFLDGYLARKNNQVTDFGKLMDPLADKVLVTSALVCFVELGLSYSVAVLIIIARDLLVTSMRLVAAGGGKVLAAGISGKIKTAGQMIAIIATMLLCEVEYLGLWPESFLSIEIVSHVIMWGVAAFTLLSGIDYLMKYKSYINTDK